MIFDTSTILAILKDNDFVKKLPKIDNIRITSITAYELIRGALYKKLKINSERELNIILDFISEIDVLDFTYKDAKIASIIYSKLKSKGYQLPDADIMIASICIREKDTLITLDKDFEKIKELDPNFKVLFI